MKTKLIITPDDSMWWILRPEFVAFIDKIIMSKAQYEEEKKCQYKSGYHKTTWERLEVLIENGLIEIKDINFNKDKIDEEANAIINRILSPSQTHSSIVDDMIFAYKYWIDFNKQKIALVPGDQQYSKEILKSMPKWNEDLMLLQTKKEEAFTIRPEISKYTVSNIIKKVITIRFLNDTYHECPLTALKEYEPFLKYIELDLNAPLLTERTAFTYQNKIPSKFLNGSVHLPVEPEYNFMRFKLSKLKFSELIKNTFSNYKNARIKVNDLLNRSEEVAFNLSEGKIVQKVTNDFININNELLNSHKTIRKRSNYLSYCFFGLSLIPFPPIAALFGYLGVKSKKISEFIDSAQLYLKGITPEGLSTYYSFNESLMDVTKLAKFPEIQSENSQYKFDAENFWRE